MEVADAKGRRRGRAEQRRQRRRNTAGTRRGGRGGATEEKKGRRGGERGGGQRRHGRGGEGREGASGRVGEGGCQEVNEWRMEKEGSATAVKQRGGAGEWSEGFGYTAQRVRGSGDGWWREERRGRGRGSDVREGGPMELNRVNSRTEGSSGSGSGPQCWPLQCHSVRSLSPLSLSAASPSDPLPVPSSPLHL